MPTWLVKPAAGLAAALALMLAASAASITPSGPEVAENLLRIELHLDRPLAAPLDMTHVVLLDASGTPIPDAFLDLPLPDRSGRTVTLLLHPGRIKSGVGPNLTLGPALRNGGAVMLRIDDPQLARPLQQRWRVAPAGRSAAMDGAPGSGRRPPGVACHSAGGAGRRSGSGNRTIRSGRAARGGRRHARGGGTRVALYAVPALASRRLPVARPPTTRRSAREPPMCGV